ncbi:MAG: hypothetical protein H0W06_01280 [Chloroflexia bacterium]|nr:hypothetical protein [Chloroflexia bacterium]
MRRLVLIVIATLSLVGVSSPIAAQQVDSSFSETIIGGLGYPEIEVSVGPDGVTAPSELAASIYLVRLSAASGYSGYLDFMQPPAGLSEDEATELALAAARDDLAQAGWGYAGGNNTFEDGVATVFLIDLAPGEYQIAASYYAPDEGSEEIMQLLPLTVTEGAVATPGATPPASPVASPVATGEPPATVTLEMTDQLQYIVTPDPVPAGPNLWELTNTGEQQSHHVVMVRLPETVTVEQIVGEFNAMMSGTPPTGESVFAQFTFVGYAALQSGGATTWIELDLEPGTYAAICFIIDPATGRPHAMDGMVTTFTVA